MHFDRTNNSSFQQLPFYFLLFHHWDCFHPNRLPLQPPARSLSPHQHCWPVCCGEFLQCKFPPAEPAIEIGLIHLAGALLGIYTSFNTEAGEARLFVLKFTFAGSYIYHFFIWFARIFIVSVHWAGSRHLVVKLRNIRKQIHGVGPSVAAIVDKWLCRILEQNNKFSCHF